MPSSTNAMTTAQVRAARLGMLASAGSAILAAIVWLLVRTWRRLLPAYWVAAELALVWLAGPLGISWTTTAVVVAAVIAVAAGWPARSAAVRAWRAAIVAVLGSFALGTVAAGPDTLASHPTLSVFGPTLAGALLGWPWWHHLRQRPIEPDPEPEPEEVAAPVVDPLTAHWAQRWQREVVDEGVCAGTQLVKAVTARPGVTEVVLQLRPGQGMKPAVIMKKGAEVEVALDLDEGAVGWQSTGKASRVRCVLVEQSYVADGVPWTGPTYHAGRCQIITYVDGAPGPWVFSRPGFGVLGGLVVGSTGAGKSRALGVLIANLLHGGWMVAVGDSQNGQSLPAWKTKTDYHAGPQATTLLARRLHAEIMHRSKLLADAGIEVFDENDPRVQALGLKPLMAFIDECQLVLIPNHPLVALVEQAAETMRKTGVGIILATQLPQMRSLGGSVRLRDALVAGNALVLRLSNRGSGTTILPDDFVGDPFTIEPEDEQGRSTAGMGYLRTKAKVGMIGRVAKLDETTAAAHCPDVPVTWLVDPIDPATPIVAPAAGRATATASGSGSGAGDRLRAAFGIKPKRAPQPAEQPVSTPAWVLTCLRRGPASAQALLDRPDCPVNQAQLYATLTSLKDARRINPPAQRGGAYTLAD